eukprot:TRINITY_DN25786_c0_g1_i1.p1 TRINITY_DN25786_c0_g1~~TRINITY_DN25786_c0_g1_i1.p1  ORF type:complete len:1007 (-),score=133.45 TRINITY_DN25786_c0_g1_i1:75-3095(-)
MLGCRCNKSALIHFPWVFTVITMVVVVLVMQPSEVQDAAPSVRSLSSEHHHEELEPPSPGHKPETKAEKDHIKAQQMDVKELSTDGRPEESQPLPKPFHRTGRDNILFANIKTNTAGPQHDTGLFMDANLSDSGTGREDLNVSAACERLAKRDQYNSLDNADAESCLAWCSESGPLKGPGWLMRTARTNVLPQFPYMGFFLEYNGSFTMDREQLLNRTTGRFWRETLYPKFGFITSRTGAIVGTVVCGIAVFFYLLYGLIIPVIYVLTLCVVLCFVSAYITLIIPISALFMGLRFPEFGMTCFKAGTYVSARRLLSANSILWLSLGYATLSFSCGVITFSFHTMTRADNPQQDEEEGKEGEEEKKEKEKEEDGKKEGEERNGAKKLSFPLCCLETTNRRASQFDIAKKIIGLEADAKSDFGSTLTFLLTGQPIFFAFSWMGISLRMNSYIEREASGLSLSGLLISVRESFQADSLITWIKGVFQADVVASGLSSMSEGYPRGEFLVSILDEFQEARWSLPIASYAFFTMDLEDANDLTGKIIFATLLFSISMGLLGVYESLVVVSSQVALLANASYDEGGTITSDCIHEDDYNRREKQKEIDGKRQGRFLPVLQFTSTLFSCCVLGSCGHLKALLCALGFRLLVAVFVHFMHEGLALKSGWRVSVWNAARMAWTLAEEAPASAARIYCIHPAYFETRWLDNLSAFGRILVMSSHLLEVGLKDMCLKTPIVDAPSRFNEMRMFQNISSLGLWLVIALRHLLPTASFWPAWFGCGLYPVTEYNCIYATKVSLAVAGLMATLLHLVGTLTTAGQCGDWIPRSFMTPPDPEVIQLPTPFDLFAIKQKKIELCKVGEHLHITWSGPLLSAGLENYTSLPAGEEQLQEKKHHQKKEQLHVHEFTELQTAKYLWKLDRSDEVLQEEVGLRRFLHTANKLRGAASEPPPLLECRSWRLPLVDAYVEIIRSQGNNKAANEIIQFRAREIDPFLGDSVRSPTTGNGIEDDAEERST